MNGFPLPGSTGVELEDVPKKLGKDGKGLRSLMIFEFKKAKSMFIFLISVTDSLLVWNIFFIRSVFDPKKNKAKIANTTSAPIKIFWSGNDFFSSKPMAIFLKIKND
jgi:hypothetical protein